MAPTKAAPAAPKTQAPAPSPAPAPTRGAATSRISGSFSRAPAARDSDTVNLGTSSRPTDEVEEIAGGLYDQQHLVHSYREQAGDAGRRAQLLGDEFQAQLDRYLRDHPSMEQHRDYLEKSAHEHQQLKFHEAELQPWQKERMKDHRSLFDRGVADAGLLDDRVAQFHARQEAQDQAQAAAERLQELRNELHGEEPQVQDFLQQRLRDDQEAGRRSRDTRLNPGWQRVLDLAATGKGGTKELQDALDPGSGRFRDPALAEQLADAVAREAEKSGWGWHSMLADARSNPRAAQLARNLKPGQATLENVDRYTGWLAEKGSDLLQEYGEKELRKMATTNPQLAQAVSRRLGDALGSHMSNDRDFDAARVDRLLSQTGTREDLARGRNGQAVKDLLGGDEQLRRSAWNRLSSNLDEARPVLERAEGHIYGAVDWMADRGHWDGVVAMANHEDFGIMERTRLAGSGRDGLAAAARARGHLKEHGLEEVGRALDEHPQLAESFDIEGLTELTADSLAGQDEFLSSSGRLKALGRADTPASREALVELGAHTRSGVYALDQLHDTPDGRRSLLSALDSEDPQLQRNAFRSAEWLPFEGRDTLPASEQGQFLKASARGLASEDPQVRQRAARMFDTGSHHGAIEAADRRDVYGFLRASGLDERAEQVVEQGDFERVRLSALAEHEEAVLSGDASTLSRLSADELRLLDSRLAHEGRGSLAEQVGELRDTAPGQYQKLLSDMSDQTRWTRDSHALTGVMQEQAAPVPAPEGTLPRLGDLPRLWEETNLAGQLAADMKRSDDFARDMETLHAEGDPAAIEARIAAYEAGRYDSQGMAGRLQAGQELGDHLQALDNYADAHRLAGRGYDDLLMRSAELARGGNGPALERMLEGDFQPEELKLMMDMAADIPAAEFNRAFTGGDPRQGFTQLGLREMRDFAQGGNPSLFDRNTTRGVRLGQWLAEQGHGAELMMGRDGEPSVMDRLAAEGSPDSRAAAGRILDTMIGDASPESRMAQYYEMKIDGDFQKGDPDRVMRALGRLRGDRAHPVQQRLNADVSVAQTEALSRKQFSGDAVGLRDAVGAYDRMLDQVRSDLTGLPESLEERPELKSAAAGLEASWQVLEAKRAVADGDLKEAELALQQNLMVEDGMTVDNIRGMMNLVLDSPTDSIHLGFRAKGGVAVELPMMGRGEAFAEGKVGVDVAVAETGQVGVSFDARLGAGVNAEVEDVAGAAARKDGFQRLTYRFANIDDASRFVGALWHDTQSSMAEAGMADAPSGPRPTFAPPVVSQATGSQTEVGVKVGPVEGTRTWQDSTTTVDYQVPWRAAESDPTQQTTVRNATDTFRAEFPAGRGKFGFQLSAEDQQGDKNQVANGTTLTMRFDFGAGGSLAGRKPQKAFVDSVMTTMDNLKPDWKQKLPGAADMSPAELDKAAREHLGKSFAGAQFKVDAREALEVTFANPNNMLLDEKGDFTGRAPEVFADFVTSGLSGRPDKDWRFQNTRTAGELELEASARFRYGTVVNLFGELGAELDYRDATTRAGSLWHGRLMLYGTRPQAAYDEAQLREMEKDGLLHSSGRDKGTLNADAYVYSLGRMRAEMLAGFDNPEWRDRYAPGMTRQDFLHNVDTFLLQSSRSMYAGLHNNGRTQQTFEEYERSVNLEAIRRASDYLTRHGLLELQDPEALARYLK